MNKKPYAINVDCLISNTEEEVYFYEVKFQEEFLLQFNGCDHGWHDCDECAACRHQAHRILMDSIK